LRQLVLYVENFRDVAIEALAPQVIAGQSIDQLCSNANSTRHLADAALDDVAHAKFTRDAPHVDGLVAI
jgi:hypothetical protein